jgi:hypothetical protein
MTSTIPRPPSSFRCLCSDVFQLLCLAAPPRGRGKRDPTPKQLLRFPAFGGGYRSRIPNAEGRYQRSAPTACDLQSVRSRFSFCCRTHVPWELRTGATPVRTGYWRRDDMRPRITSLAKGRWIYTRRLKRSSNFRRHHARSCVRFVTRTFRTSTTMGREGTKKCDAMKVRH